MNKFCTIVSFVLAVVCFVNMFGFNIRESCIIGIMSLIIVIVGFVIESHAVYFWNAKLNKWLYLFSKNDKEYNVVSKEYIYTCMPDNEYKCEKNISIYPTCNKIDRITDRFAWSAPSSKAIISPRIKNHEISAIRQQELWTYYSIYFHRVCEKHKKYETGSIISQLIDDKKEAVPFLSSTVDRKTKLLVMRVCFDGIDNPRKASFKVFSAKCPGKEIYSEELMYDNVVRGFSKSIDFPRQNWKYVISWE